MAEEPWIPPLRYRAHPMVRWFAPTEIVRGAYGEFFGRLFGSYADSRETQAALREPVVHHAQGPIIGRRLGTVDHENFLIFCNDQLPFHGKPDQPVHGDSERPADLTVDYVADIGDGFGPTFTIARQMAATVTTITLADDTSLVLPRGDLIVMGGDEVYPAAGPEQYRDRTIGPYRTAFPPESSTGPDGSDRRVPLFAIPGNHDWYDGLAAFLERFTVFRPGDDTSRRRGWSLHQTRSYYAVQLTDRWWLWGIDIALNADIDTPQMQYADADKPTVVAAGGGGAYLASTLEAPHRLRLPWRFSSPEATDYEAEQEWPARPRHAEPG